MVRFLGVVRWGGGILQGVQLKRSRCLGFVFDLGLEFRLILLLGFLDGIDLLLGQLLEMLSRMPHHRTVRLVVVLVEVGKYLVLESQNIVSFPFPLQEDIVACSRLVVLVLELHLVQPFGSVAAQTLDANLLLHPSVSAEVVPRSHFVLAASAEPRYSTVGNQKPSSLDQVGRFVVVGRKEVVESPADRVGGYQLGRLQIRDRGVAH